MRSRRYAPTSPRPTLIGAHEHPRSELGKPAIRGLDWDPRPVAFEPSTKEYDGFYRLEADNGRSSPQPKWGADRPERQPAPAVYQPSGGAQVASLQSPILRSDLDSIGETQSQTRENNRKGGTRQTKDRAVVFDSGSELRAMMEGPLATALADVRASQSDER